MINAIVLAAGESRRMGKPKPLLRFGDKTFLEHIISVLEGSDVDSTTVVLGASADAIKESVDLHAVNVVISEDWQKGQLSSLVAALDAASCQADAVLVCLVDHPFITEGVVNKIVSRFRQTNTPIIVPILNQKRGHPVLFARSLFNELRSAPQEQGARYVLHSNEHKILAVETSEKGILIGIDSPDDYKLHFGANP